MESQFLSPVGVPPHLRSEGIYRVHTSVYEEACVSAEIRDGAVQSLVPRKFA